MSREREGALKLPATHVFATEAPCDPQSRYAPIRYAEAGRSVTFTSPFTMAGSAPRRARRCRAAYSEALRRPTGSPAMGGPDDWSNGIYLG